MNKLNFHCLVFSLVLLTASAQENKLLDNLETEVEIITGNEPTGKMLMPFHRPYSYPLIVQPVNVCKDLLILWVHYIIYLTYSRRQYIERQLTYLVRTQKMVPEEL